MLLLSFFISFLFLLCRVIVRLIFFLKVNEELSARTKVEKNYQISKFQSQFAIVKERTVRRGLYKLSNELSPAHCSQRGGGFTQAGASVRLGREQRMMLPALCQTSLHPRLREAARYRLAFH